MYSSLKHDARTTLGTLVPLFDGSRLVIVETREEKRLQARERQRDFSHPVQESPGTGAELISILQTSNVLNDGLSLR